MTSGARADPSTKKRKVKKSQVEVQGGVGQKGAGGATINTSHVNNANNGRQKTPECDAQ